MSTKSHAQLSEIESAIHLKMTPDLLRYFTERSVKSGEKRKLRFVEKDGVRWYDRDELDDYDRYLRDPWPKSKDAQRPHLPKAIRREIMLEAAAACPICSHDAKGEAAHIDAVAKTRSHHPANLIWLCPNHHSVVDDVAVVRNVTMDVVRAVKSILVERKLRVLNLERAASSGILQLLRQVETLSAMIDDKALAEAKHGLEALADLDVAALNATATKLAGAKSKPKKIKKGTKKGEEKEADAGASLQTLAVSLARSIRKVDRSRRGTLSAFVADAASARARYLEETGQVDCPLCAGRGVRNGADCPACGGEGALDERAADRVILTDYEEVDCPLCKGSGRYNGDDCPECGGEGTSERRFLERVDLSAYDEVDCPVCDGKGRRGGQTCEACDGDRTMERRFADQIDPRDYRDVKCPLCAERGKDPDCPVCDGEYRLERRHADRVDLADYHDVDCKLCNGSGRVDHDDCPACGGEGEMERRAYDMVDWSQWDVVDCPTCKGKGQLKHEECRSCGSEGTMYRRQTWYLD